MGDGVAGPKRGEILGVEGRVGQTLRFLMQLTYVGRDGVRSGVLASGTRVHVMAGTAEVLGRIMLLDDEPSLAVGETRVVQVRLERPLPLRAGDHAVILSYSPVSLLGGGRVLLSHCRRARALSAGERARRVRRRRRRGVRPAFRCCGDTHGARGWPAYRCPVGRGGS